MTESKAAYEVSRGRRVCSKCGKPLIHIWHVTSGEYEWQPSCGCGVCDDLDLGGDGVTNYHAPAKIEKENGNA